MIPGPVATVASLSRDIFCAKIRLSCEGRNPEKLRPQPGCRTPWREKHTALSYLYIYGRPPLLRVPPYFLDPGRNEMPVSRMGISLTTPLISSVMSSAFKGEKVFC